MTLIPGHGIHGFEYNTEPDTDKQKINKPSNKAPRLGFPAPFGPGIPTGMPFAGSIKMISVYLYLVQRSTSVCEKNVNFFSKSPIKNAFFVVYTGKTIFRR